MRLILIVLLWVLPAAGLLAQGVSHSDTVHRDSLPQVTIKGYTDGGSLHGAIHLKKGASLIVDIIPEESIQRSTDLSIADVTRRVNGLSVTTDNTGQSDRTIIRGMDPKYNYTLIDGIKIPSPGDRSRYIPLSMFPADLVQRVEVYKSLTADMEGDAIGGVVNMVLRNAPEEPFFKVRLMSGYNQTFFETSYLAFDRKVVQHKSPYELHGPGYQAVGADFTRDNLSFYSKQPTPDALGSLTWGRRFFQHKLGVLIAADYQNINRGSTNFFIPQNSEPSVNNAPVLTNYYNNRYSTTIIREGFHVKLDYAINARNHIGLYQLYASQQDIESRHRVDTNLDQARTLPGTGRITISDRSRIHLQHIYNASLRGDHQLGDHFAIKWTTAWSVATGLYPDWSELSAGTARLEDGNHQITQQPLLLDPLTRTWLRNKETDLSAYLYLDYHRTVGSHTLLLGAGGLYRKKDRNNFDNSYTFQPIITSSIGGGGQPFVDIDHAQWRDNNGPLNPLGDVGNSNTYTAKEHIGAGYVSMQWKGPKTEWTAGLRYEDTRQSFVSAVDPTASYGKEGSIKYHDYLPSVQMKHRLTDNQLLRASWYRSLSRPALYDVTFYTIQFEDYRETGNPFVRRARADNLDLRYEWYPGGLDLLQAGVFYKHIADPYERTLLNIGDELYPIPTPGLPYAPASELTAQMRNAPAANDYGLELSLTHYFGRFGVQAEYTYTYSRIRQGMKFKMRTDPTDPMSSVTTVTRIESRPLQGQSPHLGNLSLLYEDKKKGWNARVSGIYTGRRIYSVSGWYGMNYWQRGYMVLDASLEKRLGRSVRVFGKVNNLFNTTTTVDLMEANPDFVTHQLPSQQRADRITVMRQIDRPVYYAGVQWSLK